MKTLITILAVMLLQTSNAQTGVLMQRYYIAGSLSLGQNNRDFSDNSAWLQMGTDTTDRGVLFPKVLLDSVNTSARGLYVYDLADSVLYHFDGTERVRYMTYKDTVLIKQLITDNAPDFSPFITKSDTVRTSYVATYSYVDSLAASNVKFIDTSGFLPTKSFLLNNYFANGGNSFGQSASIGTKDNHKLDMLTADTTRLSIFTNGNVSIASDTDAGHKLNISGTTRVTELVTLNDGLYFDNSALGINISSSSAATKCLSIGSANSGCEPANLKLGYNLTGSNSGKQFIVNMGYNNSATAANYYTSIVGAYNSILNADAYTQILGSSNMINYTPNSVSEGTSILGSNNTIQHRFCTIVGNNQTTTADNQLIFAQARSNGITCGFNDVYFGTGPRSSQYSKVGSNVTINASGAGVDTNMQGGLLRLAAGKSTGDALAPDIIMATATALASGTTLQPLADRWYIKGETGRLSNVIAPTALLDISAATGYSQLRLRTSFTPASTADANGNIGDIAWDDNYMYIKTVSGWRRTALVDF